MELLKKNLASVVGIIFQIYEMLGLDWSLMQNFWPEENFSWNIADELLERNWSGFRKHSFCAWLFRWISSNNIIVMDFSKFKFRNFQQFFGPTDPYFLWKLQSQLTFTFSKVINRSTNKKCKMFKVDNKNTPKLGFVFPFPSLQPPFTFIWRGNSKFKY